MSLLRSIVGPPMAAPETRRLKAMRLSIIGVCTVLVAWIGMIGVLRAAIGNAAGAIAGSLLLLLLLLVPFYVRAKLRADDAHLEGLIASGELGSGDALVLGPFPPLVLVAAAAILGLALVMLVTLRPVYLRRKGSAATEGEAGRGGQAG